MKEHPVRVRPILFSGPMVRAILEGRKTQSRRVIRPSPDVIDVTCIGDSTKKYLLRAKGKAVNIRCPYGEAGDYLWVRESWARVEPTPTQGEEYGMPDPGYVDSGGIRLLHYWQRRILFRADFPKLKPEDCGRGASDNRWRPSIHLPRWASRISVKVSEVRVERLHEISADDILAEGIDVQHHLGKPGPPTRRTLAIAFAASWDAINGERAGCSWSMNPWVWVITFRRLT